MSHFPCAAQVLLASFRVYSTLNRKYISEQLTSSAEASTVAEETFGSIRTVTLRSSCRSCLGADKPDGVQAVPTRICGVLVWKA